jgi:hypothetical protein
VQSFVVFSSPSSGILKISDILVTHAVHNHSKIVPQIILLEIAGVYMLGMNLATTQQNVA